MRFVAIDLGDMRTGVAVGDLVTGIAAPVTVIECPIDRAGGNDLLRELVREIDDLIGRPPNSAAPPPAPRAALVVGLPLNMDSTEGPRAKLTRAWARRLADATGWGVEFVDERLSSRAADAKLARSGLTYKQKKERRDAIAAAGILQAFLDQRRAASTPPRSDPYEPTPTDEP